MQIKENPGARWYAAGAESESNKIFNHGDPECHHAPVRGLLASLFYWDPLSRSVQPIRELWGGQL